eukprot:RCo009968
MLPLRWSSLLTPVFAALAEVSLPGMYGVYFAGFGLLFVVLWLCGHPGSAISPSSPQLPQGASFRKFQWTFLTAYVIMFAGDWLQGPTVYALYEYYGFSRADNGLLFIAGFGSSMVFGPFVGTAADKYGRKAICIV